MFCGWAFQAAEIRCEKNETNTYWNGLNKLLTDEFTSGETVFHEGSLNEGRFSAFRGYQRTEVLAIALTFELEMKSLAPWIPLFCFPIILHWWFSWLFFNSKHLTHFKCLHVWLGTEVKGWTATIISCTDHIFLRLQALILRVFWFWTTTNSTSSPGWSGKKRMILENCLTLV